MEQQLPEVDKGANVTTQLDACLRKLTGEENSWSTIQVNVCSLSLIGELMKPIQMDTASLDTNMDQALWKLTGEKSSPTTYK